MGKRIIKITENDLHRIIREGVQRVLMESEGNVYRNINIDGCKLPVDVLHSKIDACYEMGWNPELIQSSVDLWARDDYDYQDDYNLSDDDSTTYDF